MNFYEDDKLGLVRALQRTWAANGGCVCAGCDRWMEIWCRTLNSGMAFSLVRMYDNFGFKWVQISKAPAMEKSRAVAREEAKLRYWELTEMERRGKIFLHRVTPRGADFVDEKITVPSHIHIYDSRSLGICPNTHPRRKNVREINIREALGKNFNLDQLRKDSKHEPDEPPF